MQQQNVQSQISLAKTIRDYQNMIRSKEREHFHLQNFEMEIGHLI